MDNFGNAVADVAETLVKKTVQIPAEILGTAKKQIIGPQTIPEEKQQAVVAKKKLPGLTANDQKLASQRISQIRQHLTQQAQAKRQTPGPAIPEKPKLPPLAVRNMYNQSSQTGERKISIGG